jgi:putative two-component system response regulator
VLLVDDHPAMLRHVSELLQGRFRVVAALRNGTRLEAAVGRTHPDLIVLDITLPGVTGIELRGIEKNGVLVLIFEHILQPP